MVTLPMIFPPGADDHAVLERGMALLAPRRGSSEGDALVEVAVLADDGGLADDDAHAMVDEAAPPDARRGVDLDAGDEAVQVREQAREDGQAEEV